MYVYTRVNFYVIVLTVDIITLANLFMTFFYKINLSRDNYHLKIPSLTSFDLRKM